MFKRINSKYVWGSLAAFTGGLIVISPLWLSSIFVACISLFLIASISPPTAMHAALSLAPLRALLSRAGHWPFPLDIGQVVFLLLLAFWLAYAIRTRKFNLPLQSFPEVAPLGIFVFFLLIHGSLVGINSAWLQEWLKWLAILIVALISIGLCERYGWGIALSAILLAATINALLGMLQFTGFVESASHLQIDHRFTRAYGSFEQPNPFAGLMGTTAPLAAMAAWGFALRARHQSHDPSTSRLTFNLLPSIACFTCFSFLILALFMSWSRGAWLGAICAIIGILTAVPSKRWASILMLVLSIGTVFAIWYSGALPSALDTRLRNAVHEFIQFRDVRGIDFDASNYALVERVAHWQAALRMATDRPWLGFGLGSYEDGYSDYRLANWPDSLGHAHNYYLNMLAEIGIIGFSAYIVLAVLILKRSWQAREHPDPFARYLSIGVFGSWLYFCVHSLSDNLYVNNSFLIVGALLGILFHIRSQQKSYWLIS